MSEVVRDFYRIPENSNAEIVEILVDTLTGGSAGIADELLEDILRVKKYYGV